MSEQHEGLPVHGYKPQSKDAVELVNQGKLIEELALRFLSGTRDSGLAPDERMLALAKTNIQQGFMWAARAIFQPARLDLADKEILRLLTPYSVGVQDTGEAGSEPW